MDTATKRYSAINVGSPWRGVLPLPDGDIDAGDRQIVAFLYSGILAGEPAPEPEVEVVPPRVVDQPAGRVYAPTRRRKPRRIVFLEQELLEQIERERGLERRAAQQRAAIEAEGQAAAQAALARTLKETERVRTAIARLEAELEELRDDEDAMAIILQTIH